MDSIFPVQQEIRRFRAQLSDPVATALSPVADSRELLVRQFLTALEARDSTALKSLVLSTAEFIDLYYPSTPYTRPPYRQNPAFVWFLIQQNSQKGISRAMDRFGGRPLRYQGSECKPEEPQGNNRFWSCAVRIEPATGQPGSIRLFGSIMERAGRYKFVSYANDL
ncbi:MAG: hypothetical protein WEE89_04395 [Gemmatimonadota bacterium]